MTPYYQDKWVTIYHGDCREILPQLDVKVDLVLTDPPYGIDKAEWDNEFPLWWLDLCASKSEQIAFTPGVWNLTRCPLGFANFKYRWTLAAHLVNGMTMGRFGWGNWIPCVVYQSSLRDMPEYTQKWCNNFADWCDAEGVTKKRLDEICDTSDMGGWWKSRLPHRCQIPTGEQWEKLKLVLEIPATLEPERRYYESLYAPQTDCKDVVVGLDDKPQHPSPKPFTAVMWFLTALGGNSVLDPFLGSGTTCYCAKKLNRYSIGIEIEEKYCEIAARRCSQEVMELA